MPMLKSVTAVGTQTTHSCSSWTMTFTKIRIVIDRRAIKTYRWALKTDSWDTKIYSWDIEYLSWDIKIETRRIYRPRIRTITTLQSA